jgi:hypothetical protein
VRQVEEQLSIITNVPVKISIHLSLDRELVDDVLHVDSKMFREELRYNSWDLIKRAENAGFFLLMVRQEKEPLAFFFGYEDLKFPGGFYGDDMASLIEGKGLGASLFTLVHIYCYENGYSHFSCHAEEVDERGRKLVDWYRNVAEMELIKASAKEGDLLRVALTSGHINWMYHRHILGERNYTITGAATRMSEKNA